MSGRQADREYGDGRASEPTAIDRSRWLSVTEIINLRVSPQTDQRRVGVRGAP